MATVTERVEGVFRKVFSSPELALTRAMNAHDVDAWDSITHAEMIAAIEMEFEVKFKLREITKWQNVGDMLDSLAAKGIA